MGAFVMHPALRAERVAKWHFCVSSSLLSRPVSRLMTR